MSTATSDPALNGGTIPPGGATAGGTVPFAGMDQAQILEILKSLPNAMGKQKGALDDVIGALQSLGAGSTVPGTSPFATGAHGGAGVGAPQPGLFSYSAGVGGEAGPSSHPHGPPDLGADGGGVGSDGDGDEGDGDAGGEPQTPSAGKSGRGRGGRSATMTNDEWARQRKDNHKEVERRRRGNINDGITELGRIVPNGTGEKAKGAILSRAVQYIHHLKENEARNIEKWTLEKLLMDQAMGDLQAQLEEVRRLWEEERHARQRAEGELEVLRGMTGAGKSSPQGGEGADAKRRRAEDGEDGSEEKRQRVE